MLQSHMPEVPEHINYLKLQPASDRLLEAVRQKGREIVFAYPGSEEMLYLNAIEANGSAGGVNSNHILLKPNPAKITVLEEFLHGTQCKLGLLGNGMNAVLAEIHVKDFMLRHRNMLRLTNNDVTVLEDLKQREIDKALRAGYTPYEFGETRWRITW
jgi:hypothetical protein